VFKIGYDYDDAVVFRLSEYQKELIVEESKRFGCSCSVLLRFIVSYFYASKNYYYIPVYKNIGFDCMAEMTCADNFKNLYNCNINRCLFYGRCPLSL